MRARNLLVYAVPASPTAGCRYPETAIVEMAWQYGRRFEAWEPGRLP